MTAELFNTFSEWEQEQMLQKEAVLLAEREEVENKVYLYQLCGFYVEFFIDKKNPLKAKIHSFNSVNELDAYLDKIQIQL
jgi:hypothetical protein